MKTITPNDYFNLTGFWPASTNLLKNMGNSGITDLLPRYPYESTLLTPNEILRSFGLQQQTQNPRLRNCTPLEVMFGLCPPITPEESIEINTQEKIKQGIPEAQARKDASDEALELKAKIPTMDQWMQKIFGVNYATVKFFLLIAIILFVLYLIKR